MRMPVLRIVLIWSMVFSQVGRGQDDSSPSDTPPPIPPGAAPLPSRGNDDGTARVSPLPNSSSAAPAAAIAANAESAASAVESSSRVLQEIVLQAIHNLDATKIPDLASARNELRAAIADLERFIVPNSKVGQDWSKFLQLNALKSELERELPNVDILVDLHMNMRQNYLGLEYPPYLRVRDAINDVVRALRYGYQPDQAVEQLGTKMMQLVDSLNEPVTGAGTDRSYAVGLIANYLYEMDQVPEAIARIQAQFSNPNFQIYASESYLNHLLMRPVAQPSQVNECLLGTRILGQACLSGQVWADVLPMPSGVCLNLNLSAIMTSNNRGYNRGVVLGSTATSPVFASKQIMVTPNGVSSTPASVSTNLQTSINSIDHRLRIVRRIAQKKAAEQKPLADAIAQGRLQTRIRTQYDLQVNEQVAEAGVRFASFQSQPRPELPRLGIPVPRLSMYSTTASVHGQARQAAAYQLSASSSCSIPPPASSGIVVQTHQSAMMNALDIIVGDRTIRSADLDDYAQQAVGRVTEELKSESEGEPWSITMAAYRPVEIQFDDDRIRIKLRVTRMTRGDQTLDDGAFVTANYYPTFVDGQLTLVREGLVDVTFPRTSRGLRAVTLRSFLKGKFDRFFKEQIVMQPIDLTKRFPNAPKMTVNSMQINDGWVQLGVQ